MLEMLSDLVSDFNCSHYFQSNDNIQSVVRLESMLCVFGAFDLIFFANEIGQRFSNVFETNGDAVFELNWYLYPTGLQRIIPMLIINVQKPVPIRSFGTAVYSRKQFKKVSIYTDFFHNFQVFQPLQKLGHH